MEQYQINKEQTNKYIISFPEIYREFMNFGGEIYHDTDLSVRIKKLMYACAICNNMNWDFLCHTAIPALFEITDGFSSNNVCQLTESQFEEIFEEYPKKHKIEAKNRINMLVRLSNYLSADDPHRIEKIVAATTLSGESGLFALINTLPVFSDDPLHKKGNLLAQILLREGIIKVSDEYNMEPSIDYHVIRFFLRTGMIDVSETNTRNRLKSSGEFTLEEVTELRKQIANCMKIVFNESGISIAKQGFIAWTIGRDYCRNEGANCATNKYCPIYRICKGYNNADYRNLKEPISNAGYY